MGCDGKDEWEPTTDPHRGEPAGGVPGWAGRRLGGRTVGGRMERDGGLFPRGGHQLTGAGGVVGRHHLTVVTVNNLRAKALRGPRLPGRVWWGAGCWRPPQDAHWLTSKRHSL